MAKTAKRIDRGIELLPEDLTAIPLTEQGQMSYDSNDGLMKYRDGVTTRTIVNENEAQVLENKNISQANGNTFSVPSTEVTYSDSNNPGISLGNNVQDALDNVKDEIAALGGGGSLDAIDINYDNTTSGLVATNVKAALDELKADIDAIPGGGGVAANEVSYDNSATGLAASEVQTAIDDTFVTIGNHVNDTTAAHAASAISVTPSGNLSSTNVQNALIELQGNIDFNSGTKFSFGQANDFSVGDGIYHNGTSWVKGTADDAATLAYYVVIDATPSDFVAVDVGRYDNVFAHEFTVGEYYYLSDTVAGQPTTTEPTDPTSFSNPLFYVEDENTLQIKCLRPLPNDLGGSSGSNFVLTNSGQSNFEAGTATSGTGGTLTITQLDTSFTASGTNPVKITLPNCAIHSRYAPTAPPANYSLRTEVDILRDGFTLTRFEIFEDGQFDTSGDISMTHALPTFMDTNVVDGVSYTYSVRITSSAGTVTLYSSTTTSPENDVLMLVEQL